MDLLPALVDRDREAVDVGCNVGHYAVKLANLSPRVHAFEPHPRLAYILKRSLPATVILRHQAVSDQSGTAVLTVPIFERPVEGMASISGGNDSYGTARGFLKVKVNKTTLDELADRNIGFVKIDVEGHETVVLAGARHLIRRQRPNVLIEVEERHVPGSVQRVFDYFHAEDYYGFFVLKSDLVPVEKFSPALQAIDLIPSDVQARKDSDYVNNFIFIPRERWNAATEVRLFELLRAVRGAPGNLADRHAANVAA